MVINPLKFYKKYTEGFRKLYANHSPDHNYDSHLVQVCLNAQAICMTNNIPYTREMELGSILHDCTEIYDRKNHNVSAANAVPHILEDLGIPTDDIDVKLVQDCVRYHRASEKEDITKLPIDVQIVSASDRMKPSTNKEDLLRDVVWRAIQYCMSHDDEVEDKEDVIYSGWKWVVDTYTTDNARSKYYSDLYRNTFERHLNIQKDLVKDLTLEEVREWCKREKGIGAEIQIS